MRSDFSLYTKTEAKHTMDMDIRPCFVLLCWIWYSLLGFISVVSDSAVQVMFLLLNRLQELHYCQNCETFRWEHKLQGGYKLLLLTNEV